MTLPHSGSNSFCSPAPGPNSQSHISKTCGPQFWHELVDRGGPSAVVARHLDSDPLGMRMRLSENLRAEAWLLPLERVFLACIGRFAHSLGQLQDSNWESWLEHQLSGGIAGVLWLEQHGQAGVATSFYESFSETLGLNAAGVRTVCQAFNALHKAARSAFFAVVVDGEDLEAALHTLGAQANQVGRNARLAFEVVLEADLRARQQAAGAQATSKELHA